MTAIETYNKAMAAALQASSKARKAAQETYNDAPGYSIYAAKLTCKAAKDKAHEKYVEAAAAASRAYQASIE